MPRNKDLALVIILAFLNLFVILIGIGTPLIRVPLGLLMVLFVPGYALTAAIFTKKEIGFAVQVVMILGLSLSTAIFVGLLLNFLPGGLNATSWSILLLLESIVFAAIAWYRRNAENPWKELRSNPRAWQDDNLNKRTEKVGVSAKEAGKRPLVWFSNFSLPAPTKPFRMLMVGMAVLIALSAFGLARIPAPQTGQQGYTLLWLLPVKNGNTTSLDLGVQSMEFETTSYQLKLSVNGQKPQVFDQFTLQPDQKWEVSLDAAKFAPNGGTVEALLYRTDDPNTVYRQVKVSVQPKAAAQSGP